LRGEPPVIFGDGEQTRDFTYVENAVDTCLLAAETPAAAGEVFNVACGERCSVNRLLASLKTILGTTTQAHYAQARPGDVRHSQAEITKARRILGYEPKVDLLLGLRRTVEWFRGQGRG
jgi:UDP-glucose 4-epimerase